ncbi:hypothetical protein [Legionella sainthelensi]|uniref:hypothetical protein n=1 Tax=Legionella sainthelensi TaxID=28087 RepID=UPI000E20BCF9|nr:hypothetical protein [Legionella sainthelensi]
MIRTICAGLLFLFSAVTFAAACGRALPVDHPGFCSSFKTAATCYCTAKGLPPYVCQNMQFLYNQMIYLYGSLPNACSSRVQQETTPEDCIVNWTCYKSGTGEQKNGDTTVKCARLCEQF